MPASMSAALRHLNRFCNDRRVRDWGVQGAVLLATAAVLVYFVQNAALNIAKEGGGWGFGFLGQRSGVDIAFKLIDYGPDSTYARLLLVGVVNTLFVSVVGIVCATVLGVAVGIGRLSHNWLLSRLCAAFVEFVRNIPLLLFVLLWYYAVLTTLPLPRNSLSWLGGIHVNNRGVFFPAPLSSFEFLTIPAALLIGAVLAFAVYRWARARQEATGRIFPVLSVSIALLVILPVVAGLQAAASVGWDWPVLRGFGIRGGSSVPPEFLALLAALTTYTAGFIAEIVRAGVQSVSAGQWEAAAALGLHRPQVLRLIVIPQAMRIVIPPLTSQYVNLLKNSSYAAVIAYPEIVSVFVGSALNNTGRAVEIIGITMGIYLAFNLVLSGFMNWYNARVALAK